MSGAGQQFGGHTGEHPVIADGVVTEGVHQFLGHQAGIAGGGQQMFETGHQLLAGGIFHGQAGADAAAQRQQFIASQLVGQSGVAGEDDGKQGAGVELHA